MTISQAGPACETQFPHITQTFYLQGRYDEEIEVYRHHLEQMYKLCRPCQAAVEYYIKHQNRQLRALLLSHQFRRREADQAHGQV